eukprot:800436_1
MSEATGNEHKQSASSSDPNQAAVAQQARANARQTAPVTNDVERAANVAQGAIPPVAVQKTNERKSSGLEKKTKKKRKSSKKVKKKKRKSVDKEKKKAKKLPNVASEQRFAFQDGYISKYGRAH